MKSRRSNRAAFSPAHELTPRLRRLPGVRRRASRTGEPGKSETRLLREVERYFQSGIFDPSSKVRGTTLPPIYFQHAGHSMTIVGLERLKTGQVNLLVFDPMFMDAQSITRLIGYRFQHLAPGHAAQAVPQGQQVLAEVPRV